jgi:hypothetical protein
MESYSKTLLLHWESTWLVSEKFVPGGCHENLPDEVKAERVKSLKGHIEEEDEGFLHRIVMGNENWVHHYDPGGGEKKDGLWNTSTKYHQRQRNSKSKPLLVKSC